MLMKNEELTSKLKLQCVSVFKMYKLIYLWAYCIVYLFLCSVLCDDSSLSLPDQKQKQNDKKFSEEVTSITCVSMFKSVTIFNIWVY